MNEVINLISSKMNQKYIKTNLLSYNIFFCFVGLYNNILILLLVKTKNEFVFY